MQAVGHREFPHVAGEPVNSLDRLHDVAVDQRAYRLHGEQRNALCLAGYLRPRHRRHVGHQRIHQLIHRRPVQRIQRQRHPITPSTESRPDLIELGAGKHQHVDRQIAHPVDEVIKELQQPAIGILGILDQQHHRQLRREALEEQPPPREQLLSRQRDRATSRGSYAQQPAQPRLDVRPLAGVSNEPLEPVGQLGRGDLDRILLGDAQPLPDDLGQRPERHSFAVR